MIENPLFRKTYWAEIRERVAKLDAKFTSIVDNLDPDETFSIYLAQYPYGSLISDTKSSYIPMANGKVEPLTLSSNVDAEILKDLGYGSDSLPMGMVLERELEYFIELKETEMIIPWLIYKPGSFFPFSTILSQQNKRNYAPNSVLVTTAGVRSAFMLPNIGCNTNHVNLQRDFNVQKPAPKSLYDHWYIFKEIVNSKVVNSNWYCSVIFFAEKWLNKLREDPGWVVLKSYLQDLAWHRFEYDRNRIYYDIAFSVMQKKRNLKPNPYLADTARHLFSIALGCAPGYAPTIDENSLPLNVLQTAFLESYNIKKYIPTIMRATNYDFEQKESSIYYSLQHPSTYMFSPKSRKISSTLFEMRELNHIMQVFTEELLRNNTICADTILNEVVKSIQFNYFHNELDSHQIIFPTMSIAQRDNNFNFLDGKNHYTHLNFAEDAKFLRGCISIGANN